MNDHQQGIQSGRKRAQNPGPSAACQRRRYRHASDNQSGDQCAQQQLFWRKRTGFLGSASQGKNLRIRRFPAATAKNRRVARKTSRSRLRRKAPETKNSAVAAKEPDMTDTIRPGLDFSCCHKYPRQKSKEEARPAIAQGIPGSRNSTPCSKEMKYTVRPAPRGNPSSTPPQRRIDPFCDFRQAHNYGNGQDEFNETQFHRQSSNNLFYHYISFSAIRFPSPARKTRHPCSRCVIIGQ